MVRAEADFGINLQRTASPGKRFDRCLTATEEPSAAKPQPPTRIKPTKGTRKNAEMAEKSGTEKWTTECHADLPTLLMVFIFLPQIFLPNSWLDGAKIHPCPMEICAAQGDLDG